MNELLAIPSQSPSTLSSAEGERGPHAPYKTDPKLPRLTTDPISRPSTPDGKKSVSPGHAASLGSGDFLEVDAGDTRLVSGSRSIGTSKLWDCAAFIYRGKIDDKGISHATVLSHMLGGDSDANANSIRALTDSLGGGQSEVVIVSGSSATYYATALIIEKLIGNKLIPGGATIRDAVYTGVSNFVISPKGVVTVTKPAPHPAPTPLSVIMKTLE